MPKTESSLTLFCGKDKKGDSGTIYTGRLTGLITDEYFSVLLREPSFQRKLLTGPTIYLKDIVSELKDSKDLRLTLAIKEIDGKVIPHKRLLITEKIKSVSNDTYVMTKTCAETDAAFDGALGSWIWATETTNLID